MSEEGRGQCLLGFCSMTMFITEEEEEQQQPEEQKKKSRLLVLVVDTCDLCLGTSQGKPVLFLCFSICLRSLHKRTRTTDSPGDWGVGRLLLNDGLDEGTRLRGRGALLDSPLL